MTELFNATQLAPTREVAPGLFWLGGCKEIRYKSGLVHSYGSAYLVAGATHTVLVDTGHPKDWRRLDQQLDVVLDHIGHDGVDYLFPTHAEVAHAGNLGRLLAKYPNALVVGDTRDYHLLYPQFADRLRPSSVGERLDLGGSEFVFVAAVVRDLVNTMWAYDSARKCLFVSDGFAYMHHHNAGECGLTTEELDDPPLEEFTAAFAEFALYWTRFVDVRPFCRQIDVLRERYQVDMIAPAHGAVVMDPATTVPKVYDGFEFESRARWKITDDPDAKDDDASVVGAR